MQNHLPVALTEYIDDVGGTPTPSIDLLGILAAVLRRWKLITAITLFALSVTCGVLKLVPSLYRSTVEILAYDPQLQIDATVQKPISPFVDAVSYDAINTEMNVIKSKSVALRVATELGLDRNEEFQSRSRLAKLAERFGLPDLGQSEIGAEDEKAEKLDRAADALIRRMQIWNEAYTIFVSITSQNPIMAQRLASTIANDYLASQREARQEALQRVATWLKNRVDDLQSRVFETESAIEKLKAESGIHDTRSSNVSEQQISDLNTQLATARAEVDEKRARLEQARHVIDTNGDIQSIPELTASTELTQLREKQTELNWRATDLQNKLGERHFQVIALRAALAGINRQIYDEAQHILGNLKNAYDIAVLRQQSLEATLQKLTARDNSDVYMKLQELRRVADAYRNRYESYLSQYNEIAERRTLQDASARIISPATLPISPSSPRRTLFYTLGGILGLGSGFLLGFLLEYRSGIKNAGEIEQSFGRPVVGVIPLVRTHKPRGTPADRLLNRIVNDPVSHFSEAVHAMRISLELSSANPKTVLVTSALPGEGKSTAAMLLAASSASSGKKTVLLDCDMRQRATSAAFVDKEQPGLSELLRGTAQLADVIAKDPTTGTYVIPAGSITPNTADLLMSRGMRELVAQLRKEFDYIVMDTAPLLPVIDALALATVADKVLVIVAWGQTQRASISEAFKVLRPEADRVAGVVLNKVDLNQLQRSRYGYHRGYRSVDKYFKNA